MTEQALVERSLADWIEYIQTLHAREIDLSLDRVAEVYQRMYPQSVNCKVVTIAGTNGKGSTAEIVSSIYREAGYQVGKYTSPHILNFNERININGKDVGDAELLNSFNRVEEHRNEINLTFFEFGTLCAIDIFSQNNIDIAVLEVGLGGRLDATNIIDADVAIITSISIDHTAWLGTTIDSIAAEKIAIARPNTPCVLGLQELPKSVREYCELNSIEPFIYGQQFQAEVSIDGLTWEWQSQSLTLEQLALPFGQSGHQLCNASLAIKAVLELNPSLAVTHKAIMDGVRRAKLKGRCELVSTEPHIILDVAHNEDSVLSLSKFVDKLNIKGRVIAVCGMLEDKQIEKTLSNLINIVDEWHFAGIENERGASAQTMVLALNNLSDQLAVKNTENISSDRFKWFEYGSVTDAFNAARDTLNKDDCLIVFGSFYLVSDIIDLV